MSEVTPARAGAQGADQANSSQARQQARVDRQESEEVRSEQADRRREEQMARAERQQEAFAQDQAAKMQRREAAQEAQREENNRGQNLQVEQEQGRGQAVDTVA